MGEVSGWYVVATLAAVGVPFFGFLLSYNTRITRIEKGQEATESGIEKVEIALSSGIARVETAIAVGLAKIETEFHGASAHHEKEIDTLRDHYHGLAGTVQGVSARTDLAVELMRDRISA